MDYIVEFEEYDKDGNVLPVQSLQPCSYGEAKKQLRRMSRKVGSKYHSCWMIMGD